MLFENTISALSNIIFPTISPGNEMLTSDDVASVLIAKKQNTNTKVR